MAKPGDESFYARVKLTLLLLVYPALAWLLVNTSGENTSPAGPNGVEPLIALFNTGLYLVIAIGFLFLAGVPLWAGRCRRRPLVLTRSFRRGLRIVSTVTAVVLPVQGALLALALFVADPKELWFWGIFTSGGAVFGTIVLLGSGLHKQPGVYLTLRAERIQLEPAPQARTVAAGSRRVQSGAAATGHPGWACNHSCFRRLGRYSAQTANWKEVCCVCRCRPVLS
jgi:hypothetical protein